MTVDEHVARGGNWESEKNCRRQGQNSTHCVAFLTVAANNMGESYCDLLTLPETSFNLSDMRTYLNTTQRFVILVSFVYKTIFHGGIICLYQKFSNFYSLRST